MHAIPATFKLDHLVGRTLSSTSFGPFDLHFLFELKGDILCVGTVLVEFDGVTTPVMDHGVLGDLNLLKKVPGQVVLSWAVEGTHEFSLSLSDGWKLRFRGEDSPREDFVIFPEVQVV